MSFTLLITGATGFIGRALVARHLRGGDQVIALSRDATRAQQLLGPKVQVVSRLAELPNSAPVDACVHLAGARVIGPPWTPARRALLVQSRHDVAMELQSAVAAPAGAAPGAGAGLAIGYYGNPAQPPASPLDESGPPQPGQFQSDLWWALNATPWAPRPWACAWSACASASCWAGAMAPIRPRPWLSASGSERYWAAGARPWLGCTSMTQLVLIQHALASPDLRPRQRRGA